MPHELRSRIDMVKWWIDKYKSDIANLNTQADELQEQVEAWEKWLGELNRQFAEDLNEKGTG